jgi:hypothetical protein
MLGSHGCGTEPGYVRDIYKYYLAYRLELGLHQEREREKKGGMVIEAPSDDPE